MNTFLDIQNWILNRLKDTSSTMRDRVKEDINTILQDEFIGVKYSWNLNATLMVVSSGASYIGLPSNTIHIGTLFNETFKCEVKPADKRQMEMVGNSKVVEFYRRMGDNLLLWPSAGSDQNVYVEFYPVYASLTASDDIPIFPNKQVIANGALWLAYDRLTDKRAKDWEQRFWNGLARLVDDDRREDIVFEDPPTMFQRG
jgi:hypothetical protein